MPAPMNPFAMADILSQYAMGMGIIASILFAYLPLSLGAEEKKPFECPVSDGCDSCTIGLIPDFRRNYLLTEKMTLPKEKEKKSFESRRRNTLPGNNS